MGLFDSWWPKKVDVVNVDTAPAPDLTPLKETPVTAPGDKTPWLTHARTYIGMHEIKGVKQHNPRVVELWKIAHVEDKVRDDEVPWCAAFVSAVLEKVGITSARTGWERAYLGWGLELKKPAIGCVVVFSRGKGLGHVGFVVGENKAGHLMVLGGNQDDAVTVRSFDRSRVLSYRWPKGFPLPGEQDFKLPIVAGVSSKTEA